jgi:hypothetical protein
MSTLKIWETVGLLTGAPVIDLGKGFTYQTVAFTGAQGQSAAFQDSTSIITVVADVACAVKVAGNPVAVVTDYPLAANTAYDFKVQPGQKISVIAT